MIGSALARLSSQFITAWIFRALAWATVGWMLGLNACVLLLVAAVITQVAARVIYASGSAVHVVNGNGAKRSSVARAVLACTVGAHVLLFVSTLRGSQWPFAVPAGMGVLLCHALSYLVEVYRGRIEPTDDIAAMLYVLQLPVFPAGPLSRFPEFRAQLRHANVTMASFSYGIRRIVTGVIKVMLIADPLHATSEQIFALRVTRLSTDTAWLGAICAALETYFWVSGFSDIGIGLGRIVGFRFQENFR